MKRSLSRSFSTAAITGTLAVGLILAGLILLGTWTLTAQAPPDGAGGNAAKAGSAPAGRFVVIGDALSIYGDKPMLVDRPESARAN